MKDMGGWENGYFKSLTEFEKEEFLDGDYMAELLEDYPDYYDSYVGNNAIRDKIKYHNMLSSKDIDAMMDFDKPLKEDVSEYDSYLMEH
jgi:hypothetical protein